MQYPNSYTKTRNLFSRVSRVANGLRCSQLSRKKITIMVPHFHAFRQRYPGAGAAATSPAVSISLTADRVASASAAFSSRFDFRSCGQGEAHHYVCERGGECGLAWRSHAWARVLLACLVRSLTSRFFMPLRLRELCGSVLCRMCTQRVVHGRSCYIVTASHPMRAECFLQAVLCLLFLVVFIALRAANDCGTCTMGQRP